MINSAAAAPSAQNPRAPRKAAWHSVAPRTEVVSRTIGRDHINKHQAPLCAYLKGVLVSLKPTEPMIAECVLVDPEKVITPRRLRLVSKLARASAPMWLFAGDWVPKALQTSRLPWPVLWPSWVDP